MKNLILISNEIYSIDFGFCGTMDLKLGFSRGGRNCENGPGNIHTE